MYLLVLSYYREHPFYIRASSRLFSRERQAVYILW